MEYKENGTIAKKTYADFKLSCDSFSRMLIAKELFKAHTAIIGPTSYEWIVTFFATGNSGGACEKRCGTYGCSFLISLYTKHATKKAMAKMQEAQMAQVK